MARLIVGVVDVKDFIDRTESQDGTPINRANMMAVQGFIGNEISFLADGSIREINSQGEVKTTRFNEDGSITETFNGEKIITKTTSFLSNGNIKEVIS